MPNYYDIDDFLAEEEIVQCKTLFDFSYLSHLDPDNFTKNNTQHQQQQPQHVLIENSRIKIPLWAIRKWADLGFCRIILPIHYRSRARELIQADPASVTLRTRFYRSGHTLVNVMESSTRKNAQILYTQPSSVERNVQLQQLDANLQEARQLRETLLQTYTGARMNQTLDWALSSVGDDVTAFISKLTDMEKRLYHQASIAATNHYIWKLYGNNRRLVHKQHPTSMKQSIKRKSNVPRTVTPTTDNNHADTHRNEKRSKTRM